MVKSAFMIALLMLGVSAFARAESLPDPEELLADVGGDAAKIEQYRQAMRDPDANARLAAFIAMAGTDHPIVRQIAYEEGFASSDMQLRAMALRYSLFDRETFRIRYLDGNSQPLMVTIKDPNWTNGDFTAYRGGNRPGKVQGLSVEFETGCTVLLELNDEDMLVGTEICGETRRDVEVDIRG
ncbi:MAG: hypothetical protein AAF563_11795 [Pseudomonadota bacterium]